MAHPDEFDPLAPQGFADFAAIIAAGLEPEKPTVAPVLGGDCLFYAGRFNGIIAEPSIGKTNTCTAASLPSLALGKTVLFVDPEDSAVSAARRLLSFGCTPDAIIQGFKHITCPTPEEWDQLGAWAGRNKPELVILDGCAELLASLNLDENSALDFLKFCRERIKPFTDAGAAVVLSDHVTKSQEGRGRWGRGTGAKLGKFDGVCYSVELGKAYSPTQEGFVRLKVAKDRNGGVGVIGQEVAEIHFTPTDNGKTSVRFKKVAMPGGQFIPTVIMQRVCERLSAFPDSSLRDLRKLGKSQFVDAAIDELRRRGHIERQDFGPGKPVRFRLISTFACDDE